MAFFEDEAQELDEESLFLWMRAHPFDDLVVLDVTASEELAGQYLDFASYGFHVISANKLAVPRAAIPIAIRDAFAKTGRHWLYNATVGARLPVNHTVRDLRDSGDSIWQSAASSPARFHGCSCSMTARCRLPNWWIRLGSRG